VGLLGEGHDERDDLADLVGADLEPLDGVGGGVDRVLQLDDPVGGAARGLGAGVARTSSSAASCTDVAASATRSAEPVSSRSGGTSATRREPGRRPRERSSCGLGDPAVAALTSSEVRESVSAEL
jgi:hypothetical protein